MAYPSDPGERVATLDDIYVLFNAYLGRNPDFASEAFPRVGHTYLSQEYQIRCGEEASNYRDAQGVSPDTWCYNRDPNTGQVIPGVPTPPVAPPPPPAPGFTFPSITNPLDGVLAKLWEPIQAILNKIREISATVGTNLATTLRPVLEQVVATGGRITQSLADNLSRLLPAALELAANAADKASEVATAFAENAASVGDVFGGAAEAIGVHKDALWDFVSGTIGEGFGAGIAALLEGIEVTHTANLNPLLDVIKADETVPSRVRSALGLEAGVTSPLALIVGTSLLIATAGAFANAILAPELAITQQKSMERAPNLMLSVNEAAVSVARELRSYDDMQGLARRNGYNEDQFRLLSDLAFQYAPPEQITAAKLRGVIDESTEDRLLNRHGLDAENRGIIRSLALQLPGVQDTIRMAVREVFDPQQRGALTLDADYPPTLTDHARAIGLSEEWARNFWAAHWELPSVNQVFDMLHRSLITLPEVAAYLKAADVAPVWRDRLIALSYDVFTRVDIRRVHDLLNKDHAWLVAQHLRLGYNPEDAETLSQFTELLNSDERKEKKRTLTAPLVGRIISATVNGTLSEDQATAFFTKLKYGADEITYFLTEARMIRGESRTDRLWNLLGDLYIKNRRTRIEVAVQLRERGATEGEIAERLREWDLERELRAPDERAERDRDLTRSDIEAGYRARQLTADIARSMLLALRYDPQEVAFIINMQDYKLAEEVRKDQVEVVHRKYVKGTLDKTGASVALDATGTRATARDALLARWELEVSARTADLSVAQVGEIYKLAHWDDGRTRSYLTRLGYDEDERTALLRLWGSKLEDAKQRNAERIRKETEAKARAAQAVIDAARRADKSLATGQLLAAGAAGVLTWEVIRAELIVKGYSASEADTLIRTKQASGGTKRA